MLLRGVDLGYCWDMSGVRGFFGEGYRYHKLLWPVGLRFRGSTFVSKTTTLLPRQGNMPLKSDGISPKEFYPKCIRVDWKSKVVLNAVGLSGPGAEFLLLDGRWQERTEPWVLSFMSVAHTLEDRKREFKEFVLMLKHHLPSFQARIALQQNFSCPNVAGLTHEADEVVDEAFWCFETANKHLPSVPLVPKLNVLMPPEAVVKLSDHPNCDAICASNTIPWGQLPHFIDWKQFFDGSGVSPLAHLGGGGLSGQPLLRLVTTWVLDCRIKGVEKPIVAGGGIIEPDNVYMLRFFGADAVAIGSMSMLAPWNMQRTIDSANKIGSVRPNFPMKVAELV